ncbi:hypothetical protein [Prochlorococcus sp. MIT 1307]|uniref:hypothetical protein n=1 Tax=Prochlorococcus sp. MIT 1307 TaxID=3096219 RepID=UPI002A763225|nr:hypothetical protein [Prochlorococcus sp. MIT 1307]
MEKPVEFSKFYRVLYAAKEGEEGKSIELESMLKQYEASEESEGPLHQLGEIFLYVGIMELYKYSGLKDIQAIGLLDTESWDKLAEENKADLPPLLANTMIRYSKTNKLSKKISTKWGTAKRDIDNNIMQMARYITEGIIDALE